MTWAAVFVLGFLTEVGYVGFVRACQLLQPARAALWCSLLVALGWAAVYMMVLFTWYLALPALVGHALGTYVAVSKGKREDN